MEQHFLREGIKKSVPNKKESPLLAIDYHGEIKIFKRLHQNQVLKLMPTTGIRMKAGTLTVFVSLIAEISQPTFLSAISS